VTQTGFAGKWKSDEESKKQRVNERMPGEARDSRENRRELRENDLGSQTVFL
jgi:hypothetical protein